MDNKQEYSRAPTSQDLFKLIESLNKNNVSYLLIGGYALFAHGYERATTDIDILVPESKENGDKLIKALMILPDKAALEIDPNWFIDTNNEDHGAIRVSDEITVDIMFNACGETYETLMAHHAVIDFKGLQIHTIDLNGLIKTKKTLREKDVGDRLILERAITESNQNKNKHK